MDPKSKFKRKYQEEDGSQADTSLNTSDNENPFAALEALHQVSAEAAKKQKITYSISRMLDQDSKKVKEEKEEPENSDLNLSLKRGFSENLSDSDPESPVKKRKSFYTNDSKETSLIRGSDVSHAFKSTIDENVVSKKVKTNENEFKNKEPAFEPKSSGGIAYKLMVFFYLFKNVERYSFLVFFCYRKKWVTKMVKVSEQNLVL